MFTHLTRQLRASALKHSTQYLPTWSQQFKFNQPQLFLPQLTTSMKFRYSAPMFAAGGLFGSPNLPTEQDLLAQLQMEDAKVEADPQQRAILAQLIEKYGINSEETKEFALTTSDLSPIDEVRMLSPCGIHYTNSIYFSVLYHRFNVESGDESARAAGIEYEKCLVDRASEEYHFWSKAREIAQISAGFVQGAKDYDDRDQENEAKTVKNAEIEETRNEAKKLEAIAEKRID